MPPIVSLTIQLLTVSSLILKNQLSHESIETPKDQLKEVYDFIVVGSGSSGAIVANRLAANPSVSVLLLEAGGPSSLQTDVPSQVATGSLFNSEYDWNYTLSPLKVGIGYQDHVIAENRGHVIGGTGSFNSMLFNRGNPRTFDVWAKHFGAEGWSYREVLPYFMKYENNLDPVLANNGFHGTKGPIEITSWAYPPPIIGLHQKAITELGIQEIDINSDRQTGTMVMQSMIDGRGRRSSASNAYIDPNPYPHNLHILPRALVTRVLFEGKKAIGVEFLRYGTLYKVFIKREVIVSGGVINSPQLLMLSGVGPKEHLAELNIPLVKDLPVGDNYQNHPGVSFNSFIKDKYYHLLSIGGQWSITQLYEYLANHRGPLTTHYRPVVYFNTKSNDNKEWPNAAIETGLYLFPTNVSDARSFRHHDRHAWDMWYTPNLGRYYFFVHPILHRPRSIGRIRLASKNPLYYPIIDSGLLTHPKDYEDMVEIFKFSLFVYEKSSIAEFLEPLTPIPGCQFCPHKFIYECESYIQCHIEQIAYSSYHPAGTCRMGAVERDDVVVDPRLRVKGIDGLRVCDASIMPLLMNSNTNAGSLMIGEKCSDLVKEDNHI